jgi:hypothetical protein
MTAFSSARVTHANGAADAAAVMEDAAEVRWLALPACGLVCRRDADHFDIAGDIGWCGNTPKAREMPNFE